MEKPWEKEVSPDGAKLKSILNNYKRQTGIFEFEESTIGSFFQEICGFVFDEPDIPLAENLSSSCGYIFQNGDLIYRCAYTDVVVAFYLILIRDCTYDPTCVLCARCFSDNDHIDHQVSFNISKGSGGSCDCGEDESWKNTLNCPAHSKNIVSKMVNSRIGNFALIKRRLREIIFSLSRTLSVNLFLNGMENDPKYLDNELDDCALVLFNDEVHSYQEVIEILVRTKRFSPEKAHAIASIVDKHVLLFFLCF
jgi:E3 ubiquitin-protein ligase UBR1